MRFPVSVVFVASALCYAVAWEPNPAAYQTSVVLDNEDRYHLYWKIDEETQIITFEVVVASTGWFGLGFSPKGSMAGADIVTGWVNEGVPHLIDRHASVNGFPSQDVHNDYTILGAKTNATHIMMAFERYMDTCDSQDFSLAGDTTRVLFALGPEVPQSDDDLRQHRPHNRGARSIFFTDIVTNDTPPPKDALILEYTSNKVEVPEDWDTLYWCHVIALPTNLPKHHMIRYEPIIQKGNEPFVHHFILYSCDRDMSAWAGQQEQCFDKKMTNFSAMYQCTTKFLAGWAVGGEAHIYPDDVGFPMFENGGDKFVMLEVHYDNSAFTKNIVDSSGIRLYLTPHLRPREAGAITFGVPVGASYQVVPPNVERFTSYGICSADCSNNFPEDGVEVFSGIQHTHLLGVEVKLRHIRNGKELKPLFEDNNYDFNYQEPRVKKPTVRVMPGDQFIVECGLDSTARAKNTFSGFGTRDEMCLIFVEFFPRDIYSPIACMSTYELKSAFKTLGAQNATYTGQLQDKEGNWMSTKQFVNREVIWQEKFPDGKNMVEKWQEATRDGPQLLMCSAKKHRPSNQATSQRFGFVERTEEHDIVHLDESPPEGAKEAQLKTMISTQRGLPIITEKYKPKSVCGNKPRPRPRPHFNGAERTPPVIGAAILLAIMALLR